MAATGSILPAQVDLEAIIGSDWSTTIKLYTDVAQTTVFDLAGYTATFQIGNTSSVASFTLTSGSGLTITTGTGAGAGIVATLTDTQTLTVGSAGPADQLHIRLPYYLK